MPAYPKKAFPNGLRPVPHLGCDCWKCVKARNRHRDISTLMIAGLLGKSPGVIREWVKKLGIKPNRIVKSNWGNPRFLYTTQDLERLRKHFKL